MTVQHDAGMTDGPRLRRRRLEPTEHVLTLIAGRTQAARPGRSLRQRTSSSQTAISAPLRDVDRLEDDPAALAHLAQAQRNVRESLRPADAADDVRWRPRVRDPAT
jgi:hypothetical protein